MCGRIRPIYFRVRIHAGGICVRGSAGGSIPSGMSESGEETDATRATLLARLKDWEDRASWQDFFDTYWKLIFGVARKRGLTESEAQDVVQETMLSVAKHMPNFHYDRAEGSFKAWLLKLARWRITDQFRKRGPFDASLLANDGSGEALGLDRVADDSGSDQELSQIWEDEWRANLIGIATRRVKVRLAPDKYQIFDFCVNKGWPAERIAKTFKVPVGQVYLAKHRVIRMIRQEVERLEKDLDRDGVVDEVSLQDHAGDLATDGLSDEG
jgi:RNA polymerase sigma factor (sigma-70 family)